MFEVTLVDAFAEYSAENGELEDDKEVVAFTAATVEFCCTNGEIGVVVEVGTTVKFDANVAVALDIVVRFDVRIGELKDCKEIVEFEVMNVDFGCMDTGLDVALVLSKVVEFDVKIVELEDVEFETASVEFDCKGTGPRVTTALGVMAKDEDEEELDTVLIEQTAESAKLTVDMMVPVLVKTVLVEVEEAIAKVDVASAVA